MHLLYKLYCRAFQTCFRIALPILPYRDPKLLKSTAEAAELVKSLTGSVLLVTDNGLRSAGCTEKLESRLAELGVKCAVYDKTNANPTVINVEEARELYIKEGCGAIIAFGGGSSMDCAKAVGARIAYPKKSLSQLKGILKVRRRLPELIAIPTTAGTGSETTLAAVITDSEKKYKYAINSFPLIPHYAVLDPEVTFSLPKGLTATTGMDALTHAVEAYIGRSTTKETRRLSLEATELIFANIEKAYNNGSDREARENMLIASNKAGSAFSQSYVGYIHAVAHSLGGQYNIPHGLANSVLMPIVLEAYGKKAYKKLHRLGVAAGAAKENESDETGAKKFIDAIRALNARLGIPETLSGIKAKDIPVMARHAAKEANPLYPVPVLMDAKQLEGFYYSVSDTKGE